MGVASIFRKYSYAEIIPMCRLFCMACPELLLYWLFYNNNRSVLAAFYFMTELIWIVVNVFL